MNYQIKTKDALDRVQYDMSNLESLIYLLAMGVESAEIGKGERRKALEAVHSLTRKIEENLAVILDGMDS